MNTMEIIMMHHMAMMKADIDLTYPYWDMPIIQHNFENIFFIVE